MERRKNQMKLVIDKKGNRLLIKEWDGRPTNDVVKLDSKIGKMILVVAERQNYVPEQAG
jgi:hypothetical protein